MIDIVKQTPREYSSQSRDYQVIARLYTALFNYVKMHIDNMNVWEPNIDNRLAMLRAKTLNFEPDHSWDLDDLESITTCFKYLMIRKGTASALEYCVDILMRIENIVGESISDIVSIKNYNVTIKVPENLVTLGIVEDLVKYLLPSGLTYDIVKYKSYNIDDLLYTHMYVNEPSSVTPVNDDEASPDGAVISYKYIDKSERMFVGSDLATSNKDSILDEKSVVGTLNVPNQYIETYIYGDDEFKGE